jgi:diaminopimelate decarboxylase
MRRHQPKASDLQPNSADQPLRNVATELVTRHFSGSAQELCVGGESISAIVGQYQTPLYLYSEDVLEQKWNALRAALPDGFSVFYSMKANPQRSFLEYFLKKGCGIEIASGGELYQALEAGCPPEQIVFAGPGKSESELEFALASGVGEIHIESAREAERVASLSRLAGKSTRIALRVNAQASVQGGAMRMGGKPSPFGIDEEALDELVDLVSVDPWLELVGIHLYTGTQILDHSILIGQYRHAVEIAGRVANRIGRPLRTIDFGGGLGVPYFAHEQSLDLNAFADGLAQLVEEMRTEPLLADARLIVEPGRFLVAEAGIYVMRVIDIKRSRGKTFLITDGGMHHHLAASGNLGQTIKRNYPIALLNKLNQPAGEAVDVVGPLCTPLDVLGRSVELPHAEVGDLFGIFQSGAYGRSASPLGFLSHPAPAEVWVADGSSRLIRRRGRYEDLLRDGGHTDCEECLETGTTSR